MPPDAPSGSSSAASGLARALKIVAGASAVLSLIFAIRQATIYLGDHRDRQLRLRERLATADLQRSAHDYRTAWNTLRDAANIDPRADTVQRARETLAMQWLDNAATSQGLALGALGDTMSPVLTRGTLDATGARRADLLAHIGWADFLRSRDNQAVPDPTTYYQQAIAVDSLNPYAHAMLGHWLAWKHEGPVSQVRAHFAAALRSGRERAYVRHMELAAYANQQSDASDFELLRVATSMRAARDSVADDARSRIWGVFSSLGRRPVSATLPPADSLGVTPRDLLLTYRWLFDGSERAKSEPISYAYQLARFQEAAGDSADAASSYRALRAKMPRSDVRSVLIDAALTRRKH